MLEFRNIPGDLRDHIVLPITLTGAMTESYAIWQSPFACRIRDIVAVWSADLTGAGGVYTRVTVTNRGTAGAGVTVLETTNFNSGAVTGFDAYAIYDPATYLAIDAGTVISVEYIAIGGGEDMPPACIFVSYESQ